jgi:hypothetical protein
LVNGARPGVGRNNVAYGSLDVTCSLRWLYGRRQAGWEMIPIDSVKDRAGYADFLQASRGCSRAPQESVYSLRASTSETYAQPAKPLSEVASALDLSPAQDSNANRWSSLLLQGSGANAPGYRTVFPITRAAFSRPTDPDQVTSQVYLLGLASASCPGGYAITGVNVAFAGLIKPHGWVLPTDTFAPDRSLQLAVFVDRPWFESLLPDSLKVNLSVRCEYYPAAVP